MTVFDNFHFWYLFKMALALAIIVNQMLVIRMQYTAFFVVVVFFFSQTLFAFYHIFYPM